MVFEKYQAPATEFAGQKEREQFVTLKPIYFNNITKTTILLSLLSVLFPPPFGVAKDLPVQVQVRLRPIENFVQSTRSAR